MKNVQLASGAIVRHHKLLAWGSAAVAVAAAATGTLSFNVSEEGIGGRVVLPDGDLVVTDIKHGSRSLTSGVVPSELFAENSLCNPRMFRYMEKADGLFYVEVVNKSVATITTSAAVTSPPLPAEADDYEGDAGRPGSRQLVAAGGDSVQDILTTASYQFTIQIAEDFDAAYLVIGDATGVAIPELTVTEFKVGNRELLDSGSEIPASVFGAANPDNPLIGLHFETSDDVVVTVQNNSGQTAESVAVCITTA